MVSLTIWLLYLVHVERKAGWSLQSRGESLALGANKTKIRRLLRAAYETRGYTGMRRITTFRSTADRMYDGGPKGLCYIMII